jgi:hypothetical protein
MDRTPSTITGSETEDAATIKVVVETEGVQREVAITVSPRPTNAGGWAEIVQALSGLVAEYPERF